MIKRVSVGVIVAVGAIWVLATFVFGLWGKTAAADRLTGNLKPAFSNAGVQQEASDASTVSAVVNQLSTTTIPFLAAQLHTTPAEVSRLLASKFPAVGKALGSTDNAGNPYADGKSYLVHASGYVTTVVTAIKSEQADFHKASAIPTSSLPTKALAWLFAVLGVVALAMGGLALRKPQLGTQLAAAIGALGIVVVAVTFVLDVPGKTQALDNVTNTFRPVFSNSGPLSITEGQRYLAGVQAADVELETKVVPALPGLLNLPLPAVVNALRGNSPAVAHALLDKDAAATKTSVLGAIVARLESLATTVHSDISDFHATDRIPGFGWPATSVQVLLVLPAVLLVLAGLGLGAVAASSTKQPLGSARTLAGVSG